MLSSILWTPTPAQAETFTGIVQCANALNNSLQPAEAAWRLDRTNGIAVGSQAVAVASSEAREATLRKAEAGMIDFILNYKGVGDIPPFLFFKEAGVKAEILVASTGDDDITEIKVSGIGPSGILRGTFLLPVSGHNGNANARAWAKQDIYDLTTFVGDSDGKTPMDFLIQQAPSRDLVTFQDVQLKLDPTQPVSVFYYRLGVKGWGGGAPGGYWSGRVMEITWDGT